MKTNSYFFLTDTNYSKMFDFEYERGRFLEDSI